MSATVAESTEKRTLQCMEIWGGNRAVEDAVSVHGIDAWVSSHPYAGDEHGGDIHYVSVCGSGRIARFVVADVSGHGRGVAELAVTLRSLMAKNINRLDQTRFARALNQEFSLWSRGGVFATAMLATYWTPTDHLIICNAGHPPPLWYRKEQQIWQPLVHDSAGRVDKVANLPLGIIEPTDYQQFAVPLRKDDLILIYTDSLTEARSPDGEPLAEAGLLELIRELDVKQPGAFCHSLLAAVADYRGGAPADDDVTVLLLHHNAADPPRPSLGEMAKTLGKMVGVIKV